MMRMHTVLALGIVTVAIAACDSPGPLQPASSPAALASNASMGRGPAGVIYVTSQGLYYDTYTVVDPLPMKGRFQLLDNGQTQYGPGDAGYLGGRWWVDVNGDGVQDAGDSFFLCPLLPPGRATP